MQRYLRQGAHSPTKTRACSCCRGLVHAWLYDVQLQYCSFSAQFAPFCSATAEGGCVLWQSIRTATAPSLALPDTVIPYTDMFLRSFRGQGTGTTHLGGTTPPFYPPPCTPSQTAYACAEFAFVKAKARD
jgi:hypothetical protein